MLSLDASRLARNNRDWHQLLELCSLFGVILADGERLYDPGAYHDRLLLGLSGIMSEAELHQIRLRLHQGERQKATRGELRLPLPAGLAYGRGGAIVLNPDEEVQARLRLVFAKFRELQSAKAVMRDLQRHGLPLPVRPLRGPAPHEVVWARGGQRPGAARSCRTRPMPAPMSTAGGGRIRCGARRRRAHGARSRSPSSEWPVCLRDAHPGYIGWEEFMANQKRLADNVSPPRGGAARRAAPGQRAAAGHRRLRPLRPAHGLRYSGPHGDYPVYHCRADRDRDGRPRCQEVRALQVDALVERMLLGALAPDRIAHGGRRPSGRSRRKRGCWRSSGRSGASAPATRPSGRGGNTTRSSRRTGWWRARWSGPGRRSCARAEAVEQAYERWRREQPGPLVRADRAEVLALAQDLPRVWRARRRRPSASRSCASWCARSCSTRSASPARSGCGSSGRPARPASICMQRRVHSYADCAAAEQLRRRVRELNAAGKMDREIADVAQCRADHVGARRAVQGRDRLPAAQALGHPDGQDQRGGREPAALAGRQLLGAGRRRGARHHGADRVRVAPQRATDRAAAGQRATLADPDRR